MNRLGKDVSTDTKRVSRSARVVTRSPRDEDVLRRVDDVALRRETRPWRREAKGRRREAMLWERAGRRRGRSRGRGWTNPARETSRTSPSRVVARPRRAGGTRGAAVDDRWRAFEEGCVEKRGKTNEYRYIVATLRARVEFVQVIAFTHFEDKLAFGAEVTVPLDVVNDVFELARGAGGASNLLGAQRPKVDVKVVKLRR